MVLLDSMSDCGSPEVTDTILLMAMHNKPSVLPFPHTDISKANHNVFFFAPKPRATLTLRVPILEKLSQKHFLLLQSLNQLFLFHNQSLTDCQITA
jgi:hypothetical protein